MENVVVPRLNEAMEAGFFPATESGYRVLRAAGYKNKCRALCADKTGGGRNQRERKAGIKEERRIYYECYKRENPLGNIVISHGFTENSGKYKELIYYFLEEGYQVFILDHRGHGRSWRMVEDVSLTHVSYFQEYVNDMIWFTRNIVRPESKGKPLYLFGHSMGGAVGAAVLEQAPELFKKAVLSSPMMKINMGKAPLWFAWLMAALCTLAGRGRKYAPGHHAYTGKERFEDSSAASRARFEYYESKKKENRWMQNNGASCRWAMTCILDAAVVRSRRACSHVRCPVLVMQAEEDAFVTDRGEELFAARIRRGKCIRFPGTKHEIYRSGNAVLKKYMEMIFRFLGV